MAHKPLIDGTAYEISGGKTLVGGTAYSIKNGKALVDGVAYDIGFAEMVTITLTGANSCYAEYNGTKYNFPATFEAAVGDTINLYCGQVPSSAKIFLNGELVSQGLGSTTYLYTVKCNATIESKFTGSSYMMQVTMDITEE